MTDLDDVGSADAHRRARSWHSPVPDDDGTALAALRRENQDLRDALASQPVIDQAKGALMLRYGVDADAAFRLLVRWSQHTNTKVRDLAAALVHSLGDGEGHGPHAHEIEQLLRRATYDG